MSDKGWIGFCRSPHSDAIFSGEIVLDGRKFDATPLGFGVQGHNCGYRHRTYRRWVHAYFQQPAGVASTLEALVYDLPFGMVFRHAVLWHKGKADHLRKVREREILRDAQRLKWVLAAETTEGTHLEVQVEGLAPGIHQLRYMRTDGKSTLSVSDASLARAALRIGDGEVLETDGGAVLKMGGE